MMSDIDNLVPDAIPDMAVAPTTATVLWLTQYLQPILQILILVVTLAFLGLGVALRWRQLSRKRARVESDHSEAAFYSASRPRSSTAQTDRLSRSGLIGKRFGTMDDAEDVEAI